MREIDLMQQLDEGYTRSDLDVELVHAEPLKHHRLLQVAKLELAVHDVNLTQFKPQRRQQQRTPAIARAGMT